MKKDILIASKLNTLADGIKPDSNLLNKARAYVRDNPAKRHVPWRRFVFAGAACLLVLAIGLGAFGFGKLLRGSLSDAISGRKPSYALSELHREKGSEEYAAPIVSMLSTTENIVLRRCSIYNDHSSSEILVVICEFISVTDHGTDKLLIVQDIGGRLKDYKNYKNTKRITNPNGVSVASTEEYKNGEYYSYAYFQLCNFDYYMVIGSPNQTAGNYYYNMILA